MLVITRVIILRNVFSAKAFVILPKDSFLFTVRAPRSMARDGLLLADVSFAKALAEEAEGAARSVHLRPVATSALMFHVPAAGER
jgi:hypothetical protein